MAATKSRFQGKLNIEDVDTILANELEASSADGRLPCAVALKMAGKLDITPRMVGAKANELKIRIISCQLGCFDIAKATHDELEGVQIAAKLLEEIQTSLINGQLPCSLAFQIAGKLKVGRRQVGDTATKLKIKLADCQLGCFP